MPPLRALVRKQGASRLTCMNFVASPTVYQKTSAAENPCYRNWTRIPLFQAHRIRVRHLCLFPARVKLLTNSDTQRIVICGKGQGIEEPLPFSYTTVYLLRRICPIHAQESSR